MPVLSKLGLCEKPSDLGRVSSAPPRARVRTKDIVCAKPLDLGQNQSREDLTGALDVKCGVAWCRS